MNLKIIMLPLILIVFASMLNIAYSLSGSYGGSMSTALNGQTWNGSAGGQGTVDNTIGETDSSVPTVALNVNMTTGLIILLTVTCSVAVISGIQVLGSGLNSVSVLAIYKTVAWMSLWGLFSVTGIGLFLLVPYFGLSLYMGLTLFYCAGVVSQVGMVS